MIDKQIHAVYEAFSSGVLWHDFREVGGEEPYFDWYYAEERLYVIRDRLTRQYFFVEARSPMEAIEKFSADCRRAVITALGAEAARGGVRGGV